MPLPGGAGPRLEAPAKINLGLRILGRRPDGYHTLASIFTPLDLCDTVGVEVGGTRGPAVALALDGDVEGVPGGDANLAVRAAEAFLRASGRSDRVALRLTKRIPAAAGLGGGSSDAGAVLRALAAAFPSALPEATLAKVALELGADVPFFLDPQPALVTGIGERIEPLTGVPVLDLVLANPGVPLSTAEVYRACDALAPAPVAADLRALAADLPPDPAARAARLEVLCRNDLEPAAVRLCPPVARLRKNLRSAGARLVGLSGSGPTLYGLFDDPGAAAEAAAAVAAETAGSGVWVRVARTVQSR